MIDNDSFYMLKWYRGKDGTNYRLFSKVSIKYQKHLQNVGAFII